MQGMVQSYEHTYVKDIEVGTSIDGYFMVKDYRISLTKTNSEYAFIDVGDKTGTFKLKIWNLTSELKELVENSRGQFFHITGVMGEYNGTKELSNGGGMDYLTRDGLKEEGLDLDMSMYEQTAPQPVTETEGYIIKIIKDKITNPILSAIVRTIYKKYYKDFREYPAAHLMHHTYRSGLIYHTYGMLKMAENVVDQYKYVGGVDINESLLYSGVILHDIGKVVEYSYDGEVAEVNTLGTLLGHIYVMASEVERTAQELGYTKENNEEVMLLIHMVLSHHGKLEWGSPVKPSTIEAQILHSLDMLDANMDKLRTEIVSVNDNEVTDKIFGLDGARLYRHTIE